MFVRGYCLMFSLGLLLAGCGSKSSSKDPGPPPPTYIVDPSRPILVANTKQLEVHLKGTTTFEFKPEIDYQHQGHYPATSVEIVNKSPDVSLQSFVCSKQGVCQSTVSIYSTSAENVSRWIEYRIVAQSDRSEVVRLQLNPAMKGNLSQATIKMDSVGGRISLAPGEGLGYQSHFQEKAGWIKVRNFKGLNSFYFTCDAAGICLSSVITRLNEAEKFSVEYQVQNYNDESEWKTLEILAPPSNFQWSQASFETEINSSSYSYQWIIKKSDQPVSSELSYRSGEKAKQILFKNTSNMSSPTGYCDGNGTCTTWINFNDSSLPASATITLVTEFGRSQELKANFKRLKITPLKTAMAARFKGKTPITFKPNVDYSIDGAGLATQINITSKSSEVSVSAIVCDKAGVCTGDVTVNTTADSPSPYIEYTVQRGQVRSTFAYIYLTNSMKSIVPTQTFYKRATTAQYFVINPSSTAGYSSTLNQAPKATKVSVRSESGVKLGAFTCDADGVCQSELSILTSSTYAAFSLRVETVDEISPWQSLTVDLKESNTEWTTSSVSMKTKPNVVLPLEIKKTNTLVATGLNYRSDEIALRVEAKDLFGMTLEAFVCDAVGTCKGSVTLDSASTEGEVNLELVTAHGRSLPLRLSISPIPPVTGNLENIVWKENDEKVLTIAPGLALGYISDDQSLATSIEIKNNESVSFGAFACDSKGVCQGKATVLPNRYNGTFAYVVVTPSGRSLSKTVRYAVEADIATQDLSINFPRLKQTAYPIAISFSSARVNQGGTIDGIDIIENDLGKLENFDCKSTAACKSTLSLKEAIDFTQPASFSYRLRSGTLKSRITKANITFKNAVVVPDQNLEVSRNGELIGMSIELDKHYKLVGVGPLSTLTPSFTNLPAGLSVYKSTCIPDQKICVIAFKGTSVPDHFTFSMALTAPLVADAISLPGTISASVTQSPVDHPPILLPFTGLFPSLLKDSSLTVQLKAFDHYFDQDGDLGKKILFRNVQGIDARFDSCDDAGTCHMTLTRKDQNQKGSVSFELAIETREGSTSPWLSISIQLTKQMKFAGVKGTPVRMRLGNETTILGSTSIYAKDLLGGYFACFSDSEWGCLAEWKCAMGLCDSMINSTKEDSQSTFNFAITHASVNHDEGSVIVDWQSFDEDLVQKSRSIEASADSTVDISISAEQGGDITLPYGSDYIFTDIKIGRTQAGAFTATPSFTCLERLCRAKFKIAASVAGKNAAYFQYQVVAFSPKTGKTLRPRVYASIAFDVKEAAPRVEPGQPENLLVALSGEPANILQDINYSFTPKATGALEEDRFILEKAPHWLHINPLTGEVSGLQTASDLTEVPFTLALIRSGTIVGRQAFKASYKMDPLKDFAWHLENLGQNAFAALNGIMGSDINMKETLAQGITGKGVRVAVSDTGMEIAHADLKDNVNKELSRNFRCAIATASCDPKDPTNNSEIKGDHGTSVAGLIAAKGWNGIGSRGVAPNAELIGMNYLANQDSMNSVDQYMVKAHIVNQSWGRNQMLTGGYYPMTATDEAAIENALLQNSTVFVKSAGNSFEFYGNSNFDSNATHRGIIVVGALNARGIKSSYSSIGSNLWISAPGGEYGMDANTPAPGGEPAMITTDQSTCTKGYARTGKTGEFAKGENPLNANCDYTSQFNGTSSAAPVTSGVIALMLEANPKLTWRDVKHILASTARLVDESFPGLKMKIDDQDYTMEPTWNTNAAGYHFHNWYGFGGIDTDAAVAMAKNNYQLLPNEIVSSWLPASVPAPLAIPDNKKEGITSKIEFDQEQIGETISLKLNISHDMPGDIGLELTSPSGTTSVILNVLNSNFGKNMEQFVFLSNAFYGENFKGTWTLRVIDGVKGASGKLNSWSMKIQGRKNP